MSPKLKVMILKIKIKASSSMNNEQLTKKKKDLSYQSVEKQVKLSSVFQSENMF